MRLDWPRLLSILGPVGILIALVVMAELSKRMGSVTRTRPYYLGFYIAAFLMGISILARLVDANPSAGGGTAVIFYVGVPALSVTIAVIVAWRYWSWLLAERG